MELWTNIAIVVHVLIALAIIGLVLLQHGKGADMGSGFGSGSSGSLFGATGSANFLSRMTAVLATVFFLTSLGLAYLATNKPRSGGGVLDAAKSAPAKSSSAPAKEGAKPAGDVPGAPNAPGATKAPEAAKDGAAKGKEVPN
ncbi:MAG: preprotein translocase subunit SecG [Betaproteobacteria bacterium]|nr:preprotein translocase subunit SecG [Betaproteobacteria bacterium]